MRHGKEWIRIKGIFGLPVSQIGTGQVGWPINVTEIVAMKSGAARRNHRAQAGRGPVFDRPMKRTVEIEDTLQERVDSAISDVRTELENYLEQNPDTDKCPDWGNDLDYSGALHEIIDGSVPIYTHEIDATFYLYGSEIEQAFDDAGIGDKNDEGWPSGWKAAAIYCYIDQKVQEWFSENAEEIFDSWKETRDAKIEASN
jgi:hypothetical protein